MFSVRLDGFKTKEAAQCFLSWYEGQGEQDISEAWALWGPRDKSDSPNFELVGESPYTEGSSTWEDNTIVQKVRN